MSAENADIGLEYYFEVYPTFEAKLGQTPLELEMTRGMIHGLKSEFGTQQDADQEVALVSDSLLNKCFKIIDLMQNVHGRIPGLSMTIDGLLTDACGRLSIKDRKVAPVTREHVWKGFLGLVCRQYTEIADSVDDKTVHPDFGGNLYRNRLLEQNPNLDPRKIPYGPYQNWRAIQLFANRPTLWLPN